MQAIRSFETSITMYNDNTASKPRTQSLYCHAYVIHHAEWRYCRRVRLLNTKLKQNVLTRRGTPTLFYSVTYLHNLRSVVSPFVVNALLYLDVGVMFEGRVSVATIIVGVQQNFMQIQATLVTRTFAIRGFLSVQWGVLISDPRLNFKSGNAMQIISLTSKNSGASLTSKWRLLYVFRFARFPECCVGFKDDGNCPLICVSLMLRLRQKPVD
jgi:hypothetical protein